MNDEQISFKKGLIALRNFLSLVRIHLLLVVIEKQLIYPDAFLWNQCYESEIDVYLEHDSYITKQCMIQCSENVFNP